LFEYFHPWLQYVDDLAVVMVILCDYVMRKFQRRIRRRPHPSVTSPPAGTASDVSDDDGESAYLVGIEDALDSCRTKLQASHARSRITAQVLSIDALLPSNVRQNALLSSNMLVSAWVNFRKSRFAHSLTTFNREVIVTFPIQCLLCNCAVCIACNAV